MLVEQQANKTTRASKNGFKPSEDNPWRKFKIKQKWGFAPNPKVYRIQLPKKKAK